MLSVDVRRRRARQRGFSLIELLIVIAIILLIITIAAPQYNKIMMHAHEVSATETLQNIYKVQLQYQSEYGQFATSLAQLGPPAGGSSAEGPSAAGLISAGLASGSSNGYNYTLSGTPTGWAVSAVPKTFGSTGRKTFYIDQTGIIRQNTTAEPATDKSPEASK